MLPYSSPSQQPLWSRDSLAESLGLSANAADLKKLERLTAEADYFPPLLGVDAVTDHRGRPLMAALLNHDIAKIQSKRGKWLILQEWPHQKTMPGQKTMSGQNTTSTHDATMICAHDGRGKRLWSFPKKGQNKGQSLQDFITALDGQHNNPVLLIIHGGLAQYQNDLSLPQHIRLAKSAYQEDYALNVEAMTMTMTVPKPNTNQQPPLTMSSPSHLDMLEAESIQIIREVAAEAENPVMLYSIGKDSAVMLHLAQKAFWPGTPPFPLLHVDTGWKFRAMYEFRDQVAAATGMELLVHKNPDGVKQGINPIDHGSALHTDIMKTQGLKQALDQHQFDAAFGGARRDEEKSRAKERIFSFRTASHQWDPKNQRPELWSLYNTRVAKGESMRVFPLSNWTELDIWSYIYRETIPIVPLYFAAERPVVERDGTLIMVDDDRLPLTKSDRVEMRQVRFRTLGCYPLTGAIESTANSIEDIILELLTTRLSERQGRTIDKDAKASMEDKKKEGYF